MITGRVLNPLRSGAKQSQLYHLENVSVVYGDRKALRGVDLSIFPNDIIFVTGPSGAGKTTLLNVLAGLVPPTAGEMTGPSKKHFIASVFQDLRLLSKRTCEDNLWLTYDPAIHHSKNEFNSEMNELVRYLGLVDHMDQKVEDCNGGAKQKLAMVRALLGHPTILLADEPTSSLDRDSAYRVFELVNHYNHKKGLTIVWATHNKEQIKQYPGKIAHLDQGKLLYSGHACFI